MDLLVEVLVSLFLLGGALFALTGSIGMVRLPDFFTRLHAPTKSTTLGVGGALIGSMIHFSVREPGVSVQEGLVVIFLFVTAPVSAYMLASAALRLGTPLLPGTRGKALRPESRQAD